jgi:hypothetical protein
VDQAGGAGLGFELGSAISGRMDGPWEQHEQSARVLAGDRVAAGQAYFHVGIAAESSLKAYIMWKERLNSWPDRSLHRNFIPMIYGSSYKLPGFS